MFPPVRPPQEARSAERATGTKNNVARSAEGTTGTKNNAAWSARFAPQKPLRFLAKDAKPQKWRDRDKNKEQGAAKA